MAIGLCGVGLARLKAEGLIAAVMVTCGVVALQPRRWERLLFGGAFLMGGILNWSLFRLGLLQINSEMPMENVQVAHLSLQRLIAGSQCLPVVLSRFLSMLSSVASFGLFFPVTIFAAAVGGRIGRIALSIAIGYLALLVLPFLVTSLPLDYHLNSTIPRFGFQVVPVLCLGLAECVMLIKRQLGLADHPATLSNAPSP